MIGNTRNDGLRDATLPSVYVPYTLFAPPSRLLAVRTAGEPTAMLNAVRRCALELDKNQPLSRSITLQELLGFEIVQPRFNMALFSCFAGLGLGLAAAGIYSVISYHVTQRVHEIGVRVALGAKRGDILGWVLAKAARVVAIGLAIGLAAAIVLVRLARFQAFAATPFNVSTAGAVIVVLAGIALIASLLPAQRAANMDPLNALRHEA